VMRADVTADQERGHGRDQEYVDTALHRRISLRQIHLRRSSGG
jgi:hypothetical protein